MKSAHFWSGLRRLCRWLLLVLTVITMTLSVVGAVLFPAYATSRPEVLSPTIAWTVETTLRSLDQLGWSAASLSLLVIIATLAVVLTYGAMTIVILLRKGDDWFGLFTAFVFFLALQGGDLLYPLYGKVPGIEIWRDLNSQFSWQLLFIFLLVFPDGKFVPRWTRWALLGWVAVNLAQPLVSATDPFLFAFTITLVLISFGSLFFRYFRRADAIQRQQIKWVVYAAVALLVFSIGFSLPNVFISPPAEGSPNALLLALAIRTFSAFLTSLIPISMAIAILRYRLWDIDVIVRKTLVYGVLTATLALVFFGGVALLQGIFGGLTGTENSPVAIVLSTLAIAALFNTLRKRVQDFIDRRFYRKKYNAEQALARFAATARGQTDIEQLSAELQAVVQETMQPEKVTLWLRKG